MWIIVALEKMIDSKFPNWQIRSLDGVRLLWSLLKNPNDNVQVNYFCCHAFLYDRFKLQATLCDASFSI